MGHQGRQGRGWKQRRGWKAEREDGQQADTGWLSGQAQSRMGMFLFVIKVVGVITLISFN